MENIFKVGDRVFHIEYGWGKVTFEADNNNYYPIEVQFKDYKTSFTKDGREAIRYRPMLSFTEYTLQGFSQVKPIVLPEVGELCLVRDSSESNWICYEFFEYDPKHNYPFLLQNGLRYKQLKRIKILD